MPHRQRALLIQDISEFVGFIRPALTQILVPYMYEGLTEEQIIQWLIQYELDLSCWLFTRTLNRNQVPHLKVYDQLSAVIPLSKAISHYIKTPKIYPDNNEVVIEIKGPDLYITYESHAAFNY